MTAYATNADFEAYVESAGVLDWTTDNPTALGALLELASRDIDRVLGPRAYIATGTYSGFKLDPTTLSAVDRAALARATSAQAWHRLNHVDPVDGSGQAIKSVKGPDFETTYADATTTTGTLSGVYGPTIALDLEPIAHLRRLTIPLR